MRLVIFGYLCRDKNILPDGTASESVGGKGLFMAAAAARGEVDVSLITWLPAADQELLASLYDYPVTIQAIPMATGTVNTNIHRGDTTIATTSLDPKSIEPQDLDESMRATVTESDGVLLAPDLEEKISLATVRYLAHDLGLKLSVDIGQYFRTLENDGTLQTRWPWPRQAEFLTHVETVFISEEDLAVPLANGESVLSIARDLADQGPREIIVTQGSRGAFIYLADTNEGFDIPAYPPRQLVDPTGAGDTFIGAYLAKRMETDSAAEAGHYAAMAASLKLNYTGPLRETAEEIERALVEQRG